jgi:hypothetical protein
MRNRFREHLVIRFARLSCGTPFAFIALRRGERQQPFSLATIRPDTNLAEHVLVAVDDRRMMRSLVGIGSNDEDVKPPRPSR